MGFDLVVQPGAHSSLELRPGCVVIESDAKPGPCYRIKEHANQLYRSFYVLRSSVV
jgi:hypothetical protein